MLVAVGLIVCSSVIASEPSQSTVDRNALFRELTSRGVIVCDEADRRIKLPPPTMPDDADSAAQKRIIEALPGGRPYDDMVRNAVVAPFAMRLEDVDNPGGDPLRSVDVWFIVHGRLTQLFDPTQAVTLTGMIRSDVKSAVAIISADALRSRGIETKTEERLRESFARQQGVLFDRVRVAMTYRVLTTVDDRCLIAAGTLDRRFDDDPDYPNYWQSLSETGEVGPRRRYTVTAAYCKVTRLHEPAGALFVEQHLLFAEPYEWFRGAPLLRSKLPLAVQDSIRRLRRQLRVEDERPAAAADR